MVDALQRPEIVLRHRRAAADQQHRHAFELCIGNGAHAIGHARPGGGEGDADFTRQHRVAMRHVHTGALIAHVEYAHVALRKVIPNRLYVAAL